MGFAVLLLGFGIVFLNKKTQYAENKIEHLLPAPLIIPDMPVLKFETTRNDFGTVKTNSKMNVHFEFQNVGDTPLIIQKVDVSCGCLTVEFPKHPMKPKEKGTIEVKIDTKGLKGAFNKTLFVRSNATDDVVLLRIVGQIK